MKKNEQLIDYIFVIIACIIFTIVWVHTFFWTNYELFSDEALHSIGAAHFADDHDFMVPSILDYSFTRSYFLGIVFMIFGSYNMIAARGIFLILMWISIFLTYKTAYLLFKNRMSAIFSCFAFVLLFTTSYDRYQYELFALNGETLTIFPKILGVYCFSKSMKYIANPEISANHGKLWSNVFMFICGISIAVTMFGRPDAIGIIFAFLLAAGYIYLIRVQKSAFISQTMGFLILSISFAAGIILPFILCAALSGDVSQFFYKYFFYGSIHTTVKYPDTDIPQFLIELGTYLKHLIWENVFFVISIALFIIFWIKNHKDKRETKFACVLIFFLVVVSILGISMSGRYWLRRNLSIYPYLAFMIGGGWGLLSVWIKSDFDKVSIKTGKLNKQFSIYFVAIFFIGFFLFHFIPKIIENDLFDYEKLTGIISKNHDLHTNLTEFFQDEEFYIAGNTWAYYTYLYADKISPALLTVHHFVGNVGMPDVFVDFHGYHTKNVNEHIINVIDDLEQKQVKYVISTADFLYFEKSPYFYSYLLDNYSYDEELTREFNDIIIEIGDVTENETHTNVIRSDRIRNVEVPYPGLFNVYVRK